MSKYGTMARYIETPDGGETPFNAFHWAFGAALDRVALGPVRLAAMSARDHAHYAYGATLAKRGLTLEPKG